MLKTKIIINIEGGLVQFVWSNDPNTLIEVHDFDNDSDTEAEIRRRERKYKEAIKGLKVVY